MYKYFTIVVVFLFAQVQDASANDQLNEVIQNMIEAVSLENLEEYILTLEDAGGHRSRVTFTPGKDSAAVYIDEVFRTMPYLTSVERDSFFIGSAQHPYNDIPQENIVATIEGTTYPERSIVIGGHYDSSADREDNWDQTWDTIEAPGANDNATGVAAILEMARIMSDPEYGFSSEYTLKFVAFGAEERGDVHTGNHHGSRYYAQNASMYGEDIIGMISIDMVGYNNNYDFTSIVSNEESVWLIDEFVNTNQQFAIDMIIDEHVNADARYSDHDNFWDEGYDAVLVIEHAPPWRSSQYYTANPYYHTSSDTFERLNMGLVKKVAQLNLATVASMSGTITSIADETAPAIADEFVLYQNYPNPFNAATNIQYNVPHQSNVQIRVYDVLGKEVAELVNEEKQPGTYTERFDGSNLPSGVYFYRMRAGGYTETKQFVLMK